MTLKLHLTVIGRRVPDPRVIVRAGQDAIAVLDDRKPAPPTPAPPLPGRVRGVFRSRTPATPPPGRLGPLIEGSPPPARAPQTPPFLPPPPVTMRDPSGVTATFSTALV